MNISSKSLLGSRSFFWGVLAFALFVATAAPESAQAQYDPFMAGDQDSHGTLVSELESAERAAERKASSTAIAEILAVEKENQNSFSGPIKRLLNNAGEDSSSSGHWDDFEAVDETQNEDAYLNNQERIMREVNRQPLRRPKPFGDKLGQIENDIQSLRAGSDSKKNSLEMELERIRPSK
jgi:hypothetical protein